MLRKGTRDLRHFVAFHHHLITKTKCSLPLMLLATEEQSSGIATVRDAAFTTSRSTDGFECVVRDLKGILGATGGIDSATVNVKQLKDVMRRYQSVEAEWRKYAFADPSTAYTRNLVDSGNGNANLLILVWTPGKGSPIHDHANAHCIMKVLHGRLQETLYAWPDSGVNYCGPCASAPGDDCLGSQHINATGSSPNPSPTLQLKRARVYMENEVTYMSDQLGLHRIDNPSDGEIAVSLHLYTPPNAARFGCHVFDAQTGGRRLVQQCNFYSEFGLKINLEESVS